MATKHDEVIFYSQQYPLPQTQDRMPIVPLPTKDNGDIFVDWDTIAEVSGTDTPTGKIIREIFHKERSEKEWSKK